MSDTDTATASEVGVEATSQEQWEAPNLDVVMNIPVELSMEVGRTNITIRKLLSMNEGSVVELTRMAGEPLDVLVNGTLIAKGEVVVVDEKFGIKLVDIISPEQRLHSLN